MKHKEGWFKGVKDLNLYYQCWLPGKRPEAILLVAHGLAEHSGRYMNLVNHFAPKGYAIYSHDYQGHGKSEGLRCYVDRFSDYLIDRKTFFDMVHAEHGDTRIFLVGHSLGGTIDVVYAAQHQDELAGLMVSGASLTASTSVSPVLIAAAGIFSVLSPKMGTTVLDASTISQDKAVVDAYVNDPLVYRGKIRARLGAELIKTWKKLPSLMPDIKLPILIMHGTADRLSDPEGSRILYERVSSTDKTLKLYEGFYHEIMNEPGREQVLGDMETWLSKHL